MVIDTLCCMLLIFSAYLLGHYLLEKCCALKTADGLEDVLFSTGLGLVTISYLTTLISLVGGLYSSFAYLVLIAGFIVGRKKLWGIGHDVLNITRPKISFLSILLVSCFLIFVLLNYISAITPLYGGSGNDDVSYQLAVPKVFAAYHHFVVPYDNIRAFLPLNINMLYTFGILLHSTEVAKLINFIFGLGLFAITYYMIKRYVNGDLALLGGLLCYAHPVVIFNGTIAYIGLGLAFYFILAVCAWIRWGETEDKAWLILSAIFMGFTIGINYLGLMSIAAAMPFFLLKSRPSISDVALVFGIILVTASPWYIKNLIITGNPLFPMLRLWTSHPYLAEASIVAGDLGTNQNPITQNSTLFGLLMVPWQLFVQGNWFHFWGGFGHLVFIYFPLYIISGIRHFGYTILAASLTTIFFITLWYVMQGNTTRYLVLIVPLSVVVIIAAIHLFNYSRITQLANIGTVSIALLFGVVVGWKEQSQHFAYMRDGFSKEAFLTARMSYYQSALFVNELDYHATKVFLCGDIHPIYLDVQSIGPYFKTLNGVGEDDSSWLSTSLSVLQAWDISHVIDADGRFLKYRQDMGDQMHFSKVFEDNSIKVYAINYN